MLQSRQHLSFRSLCLLPLLAGGGAICAAAAAQDPVDSIHNVRKIRWGLLHGTIEVGRIDLPASAPAPAADASRCIRLDIRMGWALRWWLRVLHSLPAFLCKKWLIPRYERYARDIVQKLAEEREKAYQAWKKTRLTLLLNASLPRDVGDIVLNYDKPKLVPPRATYLLLSILHEKEEEKLRQKQQNTEAQIEQLQNSILSEEQLEETHEPKRQEEEALYWEICLPAFAHDRSQLLQQLPVLFVARGGPEEVALANHLSYFLAEDLYEAVEDSTPKEGLPADFSDLTGKIDLLPSLISYTGFPEKLPERDWTQRGKGLRGRGGLRLQHWRDMRRPAGLDGLYDTPDAEYSYWLKDIFLDTCSGLCAMGMLTCLIFVCWIMVREFIVSMDIRSERASESPSQERQSASKKRVKKRKPSRPLLSPWDKRLFGGYLFFAAGCVLAMWLLVNSPAQVMGSNLSVSEMKKIASRTVRNNGYPYTPLPERTAWQKKSWGALLQLLGLCLALVMTGSLSAVFMSDTLADPIMEILDLLQ